MDLTVLDVTKPRDGDGIEPNAKRARTGAYSALTRQKAGDVTKGQVRAGQGEERI